MLCYSIMVLLLIYKLTYSFSISMWCKVLFMNQTGNLFCRKGGQFELACLFEPVATFKAVSLKYAMLWTVKFYQETNLKVRTIKITTSWPTIPLYAWARLWVTTHLPCAAYKNFLFLLLPVFCFYCIINFDNVFTF